MRQAYSSATPNVVVARWRHTGGTAQIEPSDATRIVISLKSGVRRRERQGHPTILHNVRVGSVSIFPANDRCQVHVEGEADVVQIFIPRGNPDTSIRSTATLPLFDSHDIDLQAAIAKMVVCCSSGTSADLDNGIAAVLHALAPRSADDRGEQNVRWSGGLSPIAMRRVEKLIASRLATYGSASPKLSEMAQAAGLSISHFVRAFQRQTGKTPHRYLIHRRIEAALGLLTRAETTVAEVGDEVGFATPAHFVATFRRLMGVTPGALRSAIM